MLLASAADLVGDEEDGESQEEMVTEETERKFLTLGWWLLNVGWKDVAERVRSAVEVVFSGYVPSMT
jgi:peroxin-3